MAQGPSLRVLERAELERPRPQPLLPAGPRDLGSPGIRARSTRASPASSNEQYKTFDFESWSQLAVARDDDAIGTPHGLIRIPRVIVLVAFDRLPRRHVRFSRINLMARDDFQCQYCGVQPKRAELNLDHVVPRALGGKQHVGERRHELRRLQSPEGRAHADAGRP